LAAIRAGEACSRDPLPPNRPLAAKCMPATHLRLLFTFCGVKHIEASIFVLALVTRMHNAILRHLGAILSVLTASTPSLALSTDTGSASRGWTIESWSQSNPTQLLDHAKAFDVKCVVIDDAALTSRQSDQAQSRRDRDLIAFAQSAQTRRIDVYVTVPALDTPPLSLRRNGKIDLDDHRTIQWLADEFDTLLRKWYGIDGLVIDFEKAPFSIFADDPLVTRLKPPDRLTRIVSAIQDVSRRHRKHLVVRAFGRSDGQRAWVSAGMKAVSPEVGLLVSLDTMGATPACWASGFGDRRVMSEIDLTCRSAGRNRLPCLLPQAIEQASRNAKAPDILLARWEAEPFEPFDSTAVLNLKLFHAGADKTPQDLSQIIQSTYGSSGADRLAGLLFNATTQSRDIFRVAGNNLNTADGRIPSLDVLPARLLFGADTQYPAASAPSNVVDRRFVTFRTAVAEKNATLRRTEENLQKAAGLQRSLDAKHSRTVLSEFQRSRDMAEVYREIVCSVFSLRLQQAAPALMSRSEVEENHRRFSRLIRQLESAYRDDPLLEIDRLKTLDRQLDQALRDLITTRRSDSADKTATDRKPAASTGR
jgi:hypothetical protein